MDESEFVRRPPSKMWIAPGLVLALSAFYSFALLRRGSLTKRRVLLAPGLVFLATSPWTLPPDAVVPRFACSLVVILFMVRMWETAERKLADPTYLRSASDYLVYFTSIADLHRSHRHDERIAARQRGLVRIGRAVPKAALFLALFGVLHRWPALPEVLLLGSAWCLLAAYFAATAVSDLLSGTTMLVSGDTVEEVFRAPPLATSPRDFWGRRWNLMFRNSAHRLVFEPLGGKRRALWGVVAVFVLSALVHEYSVIASLGTTRGHMAAFFLLQGAATIACGLWSRRRPVPLPRAAAIALHWSWMLVTSPLFFTPILEIFPVSRWATW